MSVDSRISIKGGKRSRFLLGFGIVVILAASIFIVMGFFSKLFNQKNEETKQSIANQSTPAHREEWTVYLSTINNNRVGSIVVDLGLRNVAPITNRPNLLSFSLTMNSPGSEGLSSAEESDTLNQIEEAITKSLEEKHGAVYAGHLNAEGKLRSYYYFGETSHHEKTISEVMAIFPQYKFEYKLTDDKSWQTYFEILYPLPIQMQSIQNAGVVRSLQKSGDKLEKKRQVDHWIYFKTEADRENFLVTIKGKGFKVINKEFVGELEVMPFKLRIARDDKVDHRSVDEYVLDLWQIAQDCNGDYDGWETSIVRD